MDLEHVGVREFRANLPGYLSSSIPVAVTRHGRTVGYYLPTSMLEARSDARVLDDALRALAHEDREPDADAGADRCELEHADGWAEKRDRVLQTLERRGARNPRLIEAWNERVAANGAALRLLVDRVPPIMSVLDVRRVARELSRLVGAPVDVYTPETLPWDERDQVLASAVPI